MLKIGLLLVVHGLFGVAEINVWAQQIRLSGQVQDYQSHHALAGNYQWTDSAGRTVADQGFSVAGFTAVVPQQARYLTVKSRGYRPVQLPLHWSCPVVDSILFRVVIPLVPIDKPTRNQPYFQSEQRPMHLPARLGDEVRRRVHFVILDALTNRPVRADIYLFSTKQLTRRSYRTSTIAVDLIQSDIVAIEVRAPGYQPYLGNMIVTDSVGQAMLTIRLNPTPELLMVTLPTSSELAGWRLSIVSKRHTYSLTALDSIHYFVAAPPGRYNLTGKTGVGVPVIDTIQLRVGITGYTHPVRPILQIEPEDDIIYFAQSSYVLSDSAQQTLDKLVHRLRQYPQKTVRIVGHTDNVGSAQLNLTLSEFRAKITLAYLRQHGISETRLHSEAAGPKQPAAPNDTETNRRRNRRVSLQIR